MPSSTNKLQEFCWIVTVVLVLSAAGQAGAATASPLYARGYTVIPEPQKVTLGARDFQFSPEWRLELSRGVPPNAVAAIDQALDMAENIRQRRNTALQDATATWFKTWFPRVAEANGRRYLDKVDDVKDHEPVRTVEMTYLIYRQLIYPLGEWALQVQSIRNQYAPAHRLPARSGAWGWKDTSTPATK